MIIFAHDDLALRGRGRRTLEMSAGTWLDVPGSLGRYAMNQGLRVCDVTGSADIPGHTCEYRISQMIPPANTMLTPGRLSPQKRRLLRQSWHRSRIARIATRHV